MRWYLFDKRRYELLVVDVHVVTRYRMSGNGMVLFHGLAEKISHEELGFDLNAEALTTFASYLWDYYPQPQWVWPDDEIREMLEHTRTKLHLSDLRSVRRV